jgi:RHS repeat-associated protein
MNTGAGFGPLTGLPGFSLDPNYQFPGPAGLEQSPVPVMQIGDWNGDGLPDILIADATTQTIRAYTSDGMGGVNPTGPLLDTAGNPITGAPAVLDFDGDAQLDFDASNQSVGATHNLYHHVGTTPDLLTAAHEGMGRDVTVQYSPLTSSPGYVPATGCQYPLQCTNRGLWVVSRYDISADWGPSGKASPPVTDAFTFQYARGMSDLRGRGFLGFSQQIVTNLQTGSITATSFNNTAPDSGFGYPLAELPQDALTTVFLTSPGSAVPITLLTETHNQYQIVSSFAGHAGIARPTSEDAAVVEVTSGMFDSLSDATTSLGYDAYNNLTSRSTTWLSGERRMWSAQYAQDLSAPDGGQFLSLLREIDQTSTVPSSAGSQSVTRTHLYDPDPNTGILLDETIEPNGGAALRLIQSYDHNALGQVTHVLATAADPLHAGQTITRESFVQYDDFDGIFPKSTSNGLGQTTQMVYHPGLGVLAFSVDPNDVKTVGTYDGFGRVRSQSTDGHGQTATSYTPIITNGAATGISIDLSDSLGGETVIARNGLGHEVSRLVKNHDGASNSVETTYTDVALGQVASVTRPHPPASPAVATTFFAYDTAGRLIDKTLPDGNVVQTSYSGLATTVTDPRGATRTTTADALGRLARVDEDPTVNGSNPIATTYAYGPFDVLQQVAVTPHGATSPTALSTMLYDDLGRRTDLVDADRGHSVTSYDAFSETVTELDANGQMHLPGYDAIGRVVADYSTQDGTTFFQWDTAPHGFGKLALATNAAHVTTSYVYDAQSRPVETTWNINGTNFTVDRVLDNNGSLTTLEYPAVGSQRFSVTFGLDAIGGVSSVTGSDNAAPLSWAATSWEPDGQRTQETFGSNGETTRAYDPNRAWLTDITTNTPAEPIQQLHYGHDASGNVAERDDGLLGTSEMFGNDLLNRLETWTFTSPTGNWQTLFNYDDLGNLASRATTGPGGATLTYGYGTRDALTATNGAGVHAATRVGTGSYGYDPKGNQLTGPGRQVAYTSFGLPSSVTVGGKSTSFQYDANHQRAVKTDSKGGGTLYVGGIYEKRTDDLGNVTYVFFVPGNDRIVAQLEWAIGSNGAIATRKVVYFHDDYLGSIESISGANTPTQHLKFDPFGQRISLLNPTASATAPSDITDGFTDQEHDDELGLINMQGRIYDPKIARFISADPLVTVPVGSQGYSRYSYVSNNPLTALDPSGFGNDDGPHIGDATDNGCSNREGALGDCAEEPPTLPSQPPEANSEPSLSEACAQTPGCVTDPQTGVPTILGDEVTVSTNPPVSDSDGAILATWSLQSSWYSSGQSSSKGYTGFSGPAPGGSSTSAPSPLASAHGVGAWIASANHWFTSFLENDQALQAAQNTVLMVTVQAELVLATAGLGELLTAGEVAADGAAAEVVGEAPASIEVTGDEDVYFHYTSSSESSFSGGFWQGGSVTNVADYTAEEASESLGIPSPDKVIPIIDTAGSFEYGGTVGASARYAGGGMQWFATETIPAGNILPAQTLAVPP